MSLQFSRAITVAAERRTANHSDSESFLVVYALFSQDGCQREGFWEVVGYVVYPFDLSQTLLVGGGLLVPGPYQDLLS